MGNQEFRYTYTAPTSTEKQEIEHIRRQYSPKVETDIERLRRLHNKVNQLPQIISLIFGIIGTLIFGLGLTCALEWDMMALCVILSIIGIVLVIFAYPMYNYFLKRNKARYGEEILELSNKLLDIKEE